MELWFWWAVWWVGLGILSSIGLGTGMHSGLLFLFPHMLKVPRSSHLANAVPVLGRGTLSRLPCPKAKPGQCRPAARIICHDERKMSVAQGWPMILCLVKSAP